MNKIQRYFAKLRTTTGDMHPCLPLATHLYIIRNFTFYLHFWSAATCCCTVWAKLNERYHLSFLLVTFACIYSIQFGDWHIYCYSFYYATQQHHTHIQTIQMKNTQKLITAYTKSHTELYSNKSYKTFFKPKNPKIHKSTVINKTTEVTPI